MHCIGLEIIAPDQTHQELVMHAIYGEKAVKAGYVDSECKQYLMSALEFLVKRGAEVLLRGCTELPLMLRVKSRIAGGRPENRGARPHGYTCPSLRPFLLVWGA